MQAVQIDPTETEQNDSRPATETLTSSSNEDQSTNPEIKSLINLMLTPSGTPSSTEDSLSFKSMGFKDVEVQEILNRLKEDESIPEKIELDTCDTPTKLAAYIAAFQPHAIDSLGSSSIDATLKSEEDEKIDNRSFKDFSVIQNKDIFYKTQEFRKFFVKKQQQQLYWYGMPLESPCKNRVVIYDEVVGKRREYLMFASNNYLGLANDPRVLDAITSATHKYGSTNTGCRLIGGSNVVHKTLEERLAALKGREACIVYPSGYSANVGCISTSIEISLFIAYRKQVHLLLLFSG